MVNSDEIDRATRALYEQVRASPRHGAFIQKIEGSEPLPIAQQKPRVLVMPGAFHAEYPHTGADGQRIFQLADELGWPVERVDVPSLAPMERNATALCNHLARLQGEPIILVSLSKGGADVRTALSMPDAATAFGNVRTWINISGLVTGTPLVAWLKARPLRCLGVRLLLRLRGQRFAEIEEMRHGPGSPLGEPMVIPAQMRVIHLLGFPLIKDLSNDWARRGHTRLAPLGPNDGGGIMLRDFLELPGVIFPVWGADHYLKPSWDIRPLLLRILREASQPATETLAKTKD